MTEADWNVCTDPQAMLAWLQEQGKLTDRKARLFAVAVCRRIWPLLTDERSRRAVELTEMFADGAISEAKLREAWGPAWLVAEQAHQSSMTREMTEADAGWDQECAARAAGEALGGHANDVALAAAEAAMNRPTMASSEVDEVWEHERRWQCCLLRNLVNPFHTAAFDAAWRTPTVLALAADIYESQETSRLSELAGLLEAAGSNDAELLGHLRGPGPHYRGCWALDLVLGKTP